MSLDMKFKEVKEGTKTMFKRRRKKSSPKSSGGEGRNQDMKVKEEREEIKKVSMAQGFTEKHPICPPGSAGIRILDSGL